MAPYFFAQRRDLTYVSWKKLTLIIVSVIPALALILWEYFNGGVATHYPGADSSNLGLSNWWGLLTIPTLTWAALSLIKRRRSANLLDPLRIVTNLNAEELELKTRSAISQLLPDSELVKLDKITEYDNYYYTTHNRYMPLPVFRARFFDIENTWYYIDATTSKILARSTQTDRIKRWLYNGLHSLNFQFLLVNWPLREAIVIFLSITGVIFSLTSLVMAWRRLRKNKLLKTKQLTNS